MPGVMGVDVGGTFTDVVTFVDGELSGYKVPTTVDQSRAVAEAAATTAASVFLHGTTAATNTLLEGKGADVGLLTDPGFEDLIEIGRQDRPSLYDPAVDRPPPLVPRQRRSADPDQVGDAEIVAVVLIESYLDDSAERTLAGRVSRPTVLSSVVSPEFREYERVATTVLSAYLTPSVSRYLRALDETVSIPSRLVMTSSGGLIPFAEAADLAGRLVLSGPAGGVVAAAAIGANHGHRSVISFDMGGTSTDVCRISNGVPTVGTGHTVADRVNRVPSVPVRTIGAGGGSIAWVDQGGAMRVGPRSAGASPGPAVYGQGGVDLTVTDCNVLAGNIPVDLLLGGQLGLDLTAGRAAAERLSRQVGLDVERVVSGVLEIVDAHMERALRAVSIEEGADPRDAVLVAFGGAGGLHATRLARRLGIGTVLVPPHSGVFSALGLLLATPRADAVRTVVLTGGDSRLGPALQTVAGEATDRFVSMFDRSPEDVVLGVDARYRGQSHELEVAVDHPDWVALTTSFHRTHLERFGFERPGEEVEIVNVRAVATGVAPITWEDLPPIPEEGSAVASDGVWKRGSLPAGFSVDGPAVVIEDNSATLLEQGDHLEVLSDGTLRIEVG